jgi:hypothetical protein
MSWKNRKSTTRNPAMSVTASAFFMIDPPLRISGYDHPR